VKKAQIASHYAKALYDVIDPERLDHVLSEYDLGSGLFASRKEFFAFFDSPAVSLEKKEKMLNKTMDVIGASPELTAFFRILLRRKHLNLMGNILKEFRKRVDAKNNRAVCVLRTASPLSEKQKKTIHDNLAALDGKELTVKTIIDKSVLGGVVAEIDNKIYDGSLRNRLKILEEKLTL
jgi:F-type H+-transporting ATPase subunit delta